MRTQGSVEIAKPIAEVFAYTTEHVAEWSSIVVEDVVIEEKPDGVGTMFRTVTEDRGTRMEFAGVVTRHEPPTAQTVVLKGKYFNIEAAYTFEDLGGRTRVTQVSDVTPKGMLKVFFALFGWLMKKGGCDAQRKELENLKRLLEDGTET
jgi:hypothetical protein